MQCHFDDLIRGPYRKISAPRILGIYDVVTSVLTSPLRRTGSKISLTEQFFCHCNFLLITRLRGDSMLNSRSFLYSLSN